MGCNGGFLSYAWSYIQNNGIVTDECMPYYSGAAGDDTRGCLTKCEDGTEFTKKYTCSGKSGKTVGKQDIADEVKKNGATELSFTVFEDFMNYESGVYQHTTGAQLGGHAVMLVGWGHDEETGLDYWLCQNSWGPRWGDKGHFKILVGDCNSSNAIYSCPVKGSKTEASLTSF